VLSAFKYINKLLQTIKMMNTPTRVKDGSGALLWAAFFWQAIKSGNEQPDL
jgi:hypothetical protein